MTSESKTLTDILKVDFNRLLAEIGVSGAKIDAREGITRRMAQAAALLPFERFDELRAHPNDTVRGWAAYVLATAPGLTLAERLDRLKPIAADPHFGVREWAWLAVRVEIARDIRESIRLLTPWTGDPSPNVRRFASEATRPRGVWCTHIEELKRTPELGLPILEPLHRDDSRYVQDSVANWLNDASKTRPDWVREICRGWEKDAPYVARRASRSLSKSQAVRTVSRKSV
jgi:3-methyladenine DNA glycosylase AlkC